MIDPLLRLQTHQALLAQKAGSQERSARRRAICSSAAFTKLADSGTETVTTYGKWQPLSKTLADTYYTNRHYIKIAFGYLNQATLTLSVRLPSPGCVVWADKPFFCTVSAAARNIEETCFANHDDLLDHVFSVHADKFKLPEIKAEVSK